LTKGVPLIYNQFKRPPLPKVKKELVNENVPFSSMLVIDENGTSLGIMQKRDAMRVAEEHGLDLFCIAPNAQPPVCKILNFSKFMYEKKKAAKDAKSKQARPDLVKEIKITPLTSQHDLETKVSQAVKLMEKGWRLKLTVFLKGRMITRSDAAADAMNKMVELLKPYGFVDKQPEKEGRYYYCYMSPIKK
jgi:translation initiation factor IF-3